MGDATVFPPVATNRARGSERSGGSYTPPPAAPPAPVPIRPKILPEGKSPCVDRSRPAGAGWRRWASCSSPPGWSSPGRPRLNPLAISSPPARWKAGGKARSVLPARPTSRCREGPCPRASASPRAVPRAVTAAPRAPTTPSRPSPPHCGWSAIPTPARQKCSTRGARGGWRSCWGSARPIKRAAASSAIRWPISRRHRSLTTSSPTASAAPPVTAIRRRGARSTPSTPGRGWGGRSAPRSATAISPRRSTG